MYSDAWFKKKLKAFEAEKERVAKRRERVEELYSELLTAAQSNVQDVQRRYDLACQEHARLTKEAA